MAPVPPLLVLTLGVLGAALVVKHFAKGWRQEDADFDRADAVEDSKSKSVPTLRRDPQTGIYRP